MRLKVIGLNPVYLLKSVLLYLPASEVGFTVRMMGCPLVGGGLAKCICGSDRALLTDGKDGTLWSG